MDYWDFDHVIEQQEMIYTDLHIITLASRNARCINLQAWDMKYTSRIFIMNMTSFKAPGGAENINII